MVQLQLWHNPLCYLGHVDFQQQHHTKRQTSHPWDRSQPAYCIWSQCVDCCKPLAPAYSLPKVFGPLDPQVDSEVRSVLRHAVVHSGTHAIVRLLAQLATAAFPPRWLTHWDAVAWIESVQYFRSTLSDSIQSFHQHFVSLERHSACMYLPPMVTSHKPCATLLARYSMSLKNHHLQIRNHPRVLQRDQQRESPHVHRFPKASSSTVLSAKQ